MYQLLMNNIRKIVQPNAKLKLRTYLKKTPPTMFQFKNVSSMPMGHDETETEYEERMIACFNSNAIDGWTLRKGLNDLAGFDAVPSPPIIIAALRAARRLNDYAVATRTIEMVRHKCGNAHDKIYPYIMKEICPIMQELGIESLEEMGYDEPELWCESVFDMHEC